MSDVAEISEDHDQSLSHSSTLTDSERNRLLVEWNDTQMDYPMDKCVHHLFEEQVRRTPDATAAVFENRQLTYRELGQRANQVARCLIKLGVGPDTLVGVCIDRSLDMLVGLIGIWKAGGAYVPIDPRYPSDRLSFMLQDSGLKVLLTQEALRSKFSQYIGQLLCIESDTVRREGSGDCSAEVRPENLAYVIYTSGSTGKPKGVEIFHRALVNFLISMQSRPGMTADDVLLAVTTISFDIAGLELYLPLIVGGCVLLVSREVAADGYKLRDTLEKSRATVMQATPATWRLLVEAGWQGSKRLKVLCGGEAIPRDLAGELLHRASTVWNMYGPTETTVWSTTGQITSNHGPITVGRPIANTEIYILDSNLEPVPVGTAGELYIGGDSVARGYLHRPDLTADKFIPHPFRAKGRGERLYRTGDLARYRPDGEIECLGRIDNQVKVRGFRIELGEIESVLAEFPGANQNVVVAWGNASGDKQLVAYIALGQAKPLAADRLREFLKPRLPDYMLPARFVFLETLPLTPNGKVDRRALPPPPQELEPTPEKEQVAPRNDVERRLAQIWESVLNLRNLGIKESFFELGGHSLLVAKLLRRIEHTFGTKLSITAIFEAPTIEQQALMLRDGSSLRWAPAIIPIQPNGSKAPFFCFGYGAGPIFLTLAQQLGSDQPLLGVDPTLLSTSHLPDPCSMSDMAATIARLIRELQPEGPYYLGGLCGGGLVAYETASQLRAQGQEIGLLALFEPHPSYADSVAHAKGSWLMQRLQFHAGNLRRLEWDEMGTYVRDHIRERSRVLLRYGKSRFQSTFAKLQPGADENSRRAIRAVIDSAYRGYRPRPFAGPVMLFQATRREPGGNWERDYWIALANQLDICEIVGYSNWLVRFFARPSVDVLADNLRTRLPGATTSGSLQRNGAA